MKDHLLYNRARNAVAFLSSSIILSSCFFQKQGHLSVHWCLVPADRKDDQLSSYHHWLRHFDGLKAIVLSICHFSALASPVSSVDMVVFIKEFYFLEHRSSSWGLVCCLVWVEYILSKSGVPVIIEVMRKLSVDRRLLSMWRFNSIYEKRFYRLCRHPLSILLDTWLGAARLIEPCWG